jgi:hypothetical protein
MLRQAFNAMREVILAMQGVRGDERDSRATAEELSSLYNRIFVLEREAVVLQQEVDNSRRISGAIDAAGDGDQSNAVGFVYDAGDYTGVMATTDDDDTAVLSGTVRTSGTISLTTLGDSSSITATVS